jgi:NAD(P)-dependent dehydrogenase (short-subunit alcohol dehydrogenase family)
MDVLEGKVAVITGGASGIGRAMAQRFRDDGMTVVIADIQQYALEATAGELGVEGVRTDVSDLASVEALADEVVRRHGAVHLICNNAGVNAAGRLDATTLRDWQWVIGVNLWGVVHGLLAFLPRLQANADGGHVVNSASMAGLAPFPGVGVYTATKYAIVGLSEVLAIELAGSAVGVSVLCPGMVDTNIRTSFRNRPEHLRDAGAGPGSGTDALPELVGLDPAVVAAQVSQAVREERFWIFTHPDSLAAVDARYRALSAGAAEG